MTFFTQLQSFLRSYGPLYQNLLPIALTFFFFYNELTFQLNSLSHVTTLRSYRVGNSTNHGSLLWPKVTSSSLHTHRNSFKGTYLNLSLWRNEDLGMVFRSFDVYTLIRSIRVLFRVSSSTHLSIHETLKSNQTGSVIQMDLSFRGTPWGREGMKQQ